VATTFGVILWNSLLIGVGYVSVLTGDGTKPFTVAVKMVFVLLLGEFVAAAAWRSFAFWRGQRQ
jgi:hypothetical protein